MKKIIQTKLHNPPNSRGNCFATVIACLMDLEIKDIIVIEDLYETNPNDWYTILEN